MPIDIVRDSAIRTFSGSTIGGGLVSDRYGDNGAMRRRQRFMRGDGPL